MQRLANAAITAIVFLCATITHAAVLTWNLTTDYSSTANPNTPWTYGYRLGSASGTALTLYTINANQVGSTATNNVWHGPTFTPQIAKNISLTTFDGNDGTLIPAGEIALHPGGLGTASFSQNAWSVARWTAPILSIYQVTFSLARFGGTLDGFSSFDLVLNGTSQYNQFVSGYPFGAPITRTYLLHAGDTLDFAVGIGNSTDNHDSTGLRTAIAIVPEPSSLALLPLSLLFARRPSRR